MYTFGEDIQIDLKRHMTNCADYMRGFDCGDPVFNERLYEDAANPDHVSYCFVDRNTQEVVCYASLASTVVSDRIGEPVPAVEIKAFAVNSKYQHMQYSRTMDKKTTLSVAFLFYMCGVVQEICETHLGARFLVVYSVPNAVNFYKKAFFDEMDEEMQVVHALDNEGCKALYKYIAD